MLWTVGLAVFTQDQGIAATLTGTQCSRETMRTTNCTIIVYEENEYGIMEREEIPCSDLPRQVPGSNLYWSVWVCFLASLNVSFRWKAAQAMQFAQAQEEEERKRVEGTDGQALENQEDDDDDDDDV